VGAVADFGPSARMWFGQGDGADERRPAADQSTRNGWSGASHGELMP
jgi:hypothetical protein